MRCMRTCLAVVSACAAALVPHAVVAPRAPFVPSVIDPAAALETHAAAQSDSDPQAAADARLRRQLHWIEIRFGREDLWTLDLPSRVLLARSAADRAHLADVGLTWRDVYGLIEAETSWVPRRGASKDGTPNVGLAQFEPATARALGVQDPDDAVEAVHAAALYMREAAVWSQQRLTRLRLPRAERERRLREGVSVYYNLSWKARRTWNGRNTKSLPRETQRHIETLRVASEEAALLDAQLKAMPAARRERGVLTADGSAGRG